MGTLGQGRYKGSVLPGKGQKECNRGERERVVSREVQLCMSSASRSLGMRIAP